LANDSDPNEPPNALPSQRGLEAHVDHISFGVSEHEYSLDPHTGTLSLVVGTSTTPRTAFITYHDTNKQNIASTLTSAKIFIQETPPEADLLTPCGTSSTQPQGHERRATAPMYVAMGDSFSAGEGDKGYIENTDDSSSDMCHRSKYAYGQLLINQLRGWRHRFIACSGAQTYNVTTVPGPNGPITAHPQTFRTDCDQYGECIGTSEEESQIEELRKALPRIRLITLTIGGNDLGFAPELKRCITHYLVEVCHPKLRLFTDGDSSTYTDAGFRARLEAVYRKIHEVAPAATLIVLGYPQLFSRLANQFLNEPECALHLSDAVEVTKLEEHANDEISKALKAVDPAPGGSWAHYVNNDHTFDGHELCQEVGHHWINGLLSWDPEAFHPGREGQDHLFKKLWGEKFLQKAIQ
jgi:lysophospholipase L1-like esterase